MLLRDGPTIDIVSGNARCRGRRATRASWRIRLFMDVGGSTHALSEVVDFDKVLLVRSNYNAFPQSHVIHDLKSPARVPVLAAGKEDVHEDKHNCARKQRVHVEREKEIWDCLAGCSKAVTGVGHHEAHQSFCAHSVDERSLEYSRPPQCTSRGDGELRQRLCCYDHVQLFAQI